MIKAQPSSLLCSQRIKIYYHFISKLTRLVGEGLGGGEQLTDARLRFATGGAHELRATDFDIGQA